MIDCPTVTRRLDLPAATLGFFAALNRDVWRRAFMGAVVICHVGLLAWSASRQSPTVDEVAHLPAGISHWRFSSFSLYAVNPPLVRMVAAVPVLFASPSTNWRQAGGAMIARPEFAVGSDFVDANGERAFWLFTIARWVCIPFSVLGALICYRWSAELYGPRAGLIALWLWCFCPNVLAHAQLITPDVGAASIGAAALYCFWRWQRRPTWPTTLATGLMIGLAELAKSTWLVLFVLLPILCLLFRRSQSSRARPAFSRSLAQVSAILAIALFVLNAGYQFKGSFRRLDEFKFHSARLSGAMAESFKAGNRFRERWIGSLPLPLPEDYVRGLDIQARDFEGGRFSYLRGDLRTGGWWYYYLYALGVKLPVGTWILVTLTTVGVLFRGQRAILCRDELAVVLPAAALLVLVSSNTGLNQHLRYLLPAFPLAFVFIGRVARDATTYPKSVGSLVVASLIAVALSSLRSYPHQLSYFNELAGGPSRGHEHLLDSNIDWGQDLLELKRWLGRHPEVGTIGLAYYGTFDPRIAGIDYVPIDEMAANIEPKDAPEWYAVSVNYLYGYGLGGLSRFQGCERFRRLKPVDMAGYSMYIYHQPPRKEADASSSPRASRHDPFGAEVRHAALAAPHGCRSFEGAFKPRSEREFRW